MNIENYCASFAGVRPNGECYRYSFRSLAVKVYKQLCIIVLFGLICLQPLQAAERFALVIGNAAYAEQSLKNPVNDAEDVASKLGTQGFKVTLLQNATKRRMKDAFREFERDLIGQEKIGLFYYAGHGVEVGGRNYLIPVDADIRSEADVEYEAVNAGRVLLGMENAGNSLNMVVLDACRNNPYKSSFRSASRGLQRMGAPKGSIILYAAQPGNVAQDGEGRNGVFTKHFLSALNNPGLKVEEVFKKTARGVNSETGGKQVPWLEGVVLGDFYFMGDTTVEIKPDSSLTGNYSAALEVSYWNSIQDSDNPAEYRSYMAQFPNGTFVRLAKVRLKQLQERTVAKPKHEDNSSINIRLVQCQAHFDANRLTTGSGGNALDCYKDLLRVYPGQTDALSGLTKIENRYIAWIRREIGKKNAHKAQQYLDRLRVVNPEHNEVAAWRRISLRSALVNPR